MNLVRIDPSFKALPHIGYMVDKHGDLPSLAHGPWSVHTLQSPPHDELVYFLLKILMEIGSMGKNTHQNLFFF